jgi:murein DD-endopeptidase MepM/ murein hydrolase activator NlpD
VPLLRPALVALTVAAAWGCPALPAIGAAGAAGAAGATGATGATATGTTWRWPLEPAPSVVTPFHAPAGPFAAGHRGVDLAATVGAAVRAAGAGTVAFAGPVAGRPVVSVDHPGGLRTTYEPVTPAVRRGDPVARSDPLGAVAAAPGHCLPATCLHWGLRRGEVYLDPLTLVGAGAAVRLLPVWGWPPGPALPRTAPAPGLRASPGPTATAGLDAAPSPAAGRGGNRRPDRGPLLVADRLRAGRAGRSRAAGSRRARCRRGRRGAGSRAPPRR